MIIYKTTNLINGKIYIGQDKHNNKSYFGSSKLIRRSIAKYGIENFKKDILEYCDSTKHMNERERYWIHELCSLHPVGYNIAKGSSGGDTLTNHPDKYAIYAKQGDARRGKTYPNISKALLGKSRPAISKALKGRRNEKLSAAIRGKSRPELSTALSIEILIDENIYKNGRDAASHLKIRRSTIIERCKSAEAEWSNWYYLSRQKDIAKLTLDDTRKTMHVEFILGTEKTLLVKICNSRQWFPKSQVKFNAEANELDCPVWLLKKKWPNENW